MSKSCIACHSQSIIERYTLYDDRYGYPGFFSLFQCRGCNHYFLKQNFSVNDLEELYTKYYPRASFSLEDFRPQKEISGFRAWLDGAQASAFRWVPRDVRVLDIGCGFGETLAYHQMRGCEVHGVEADENIRKVAQEFGFNVKVGVFDHKNYAKEYFDYVTMDQVLEHTMDPKDTLEGVRQVLRQGGRLILTFPNAHGWGRRAFRKRWLHWHTPYHLHFFSKESLRILARETGFEVLLNHSLTPSAWLHYQFLHLLTYPQESEPSVFWWHNGLTKKTSWTFFQKLMRICLEVVFRLKIYHVLTRCLDFLGLGDSRIIILKKL